MKKHSCCWVLRSQNLELLTIAGTRRGFEVEDTNNAKFSSPCVFCVDYEINIIVSDYCHDRIQKSQEVKLCKTFSEPTKENEY